MGMRVGIPNAGQLNALETLNIRGERSVTCKGAFDAHPSTGPLPAGAPAACEAFRQQPDALERAAELDAQYGATPDLAAMPMYCVVTAVKDPFDTKDMRTTANSDVAFAMDVPPFDATLVARLRAKGAIIYAKSVGARVQRRPGQPRRAGREPDEHWWRAGRPSARGRGQACNPYDTERVLADRAAARAWRCRRTWRPSASASRPSRRARGRRPATASRRCCRPRAVVPDNGGIGNHWFVDRAGIHARTLGDAAKVLDALRVSSTSYYDSRDPFTAIPKALIPGAAVRQFFAGRRGGRERRRSRSQGLRIAILREHMVKPTQNHEAISDQVDREIKTVLRDRLGAELVETHHANVSRRSRRAEPDLHLRRRAVGAAAADDAGNLHAS